MAKRYTDSEKWDDPWFIELPAKYKFLWLFILDKCDHAGIYKFSKRAAEFNIEQEINIEEIRALFADRIHIIDTEKWFIPKFIKFQYGKLNPKNQVHESVIRHLQDAGILSLVSDLILDSPSQAPAQPLTRGLQGDKDKDKDKDGDKDKDEDKDLKTPPSEIANVRHQNSNLMDKELHFFVEGAKKLGQSMSISDFTDDFRFALRNVLDNRAQGGAEKWLRACENLARAPDDVRYVKSVLWLLERKNMALNRVVTCAAMSNGNGSAGPRPSRYEPPEGWSLTGYADSKAAAQ